MRAPFQILAIPYMVADGSVLYCVFRRADLDQWQFIAGGGEDDETPAQAARREIQEESGVAAGSVMPLRSMCCIPANIFPKGDSDHWPKDTYVVPEYAFAFECNAPIRLSPEHTEYAWLNYEAALPVLTWDSNRTALYELNCRLLAV